MKLYLIRHAIADVRDPEKYPDDGQRPLTETGIKKMGKIAKGLRRMKPEIKVILSSPLLRSKDTAEIVRKQLDLKKNQVILTDLLVPGFDPAKLIVEIQTKYMVNALALVAHEPDMSSFISLLLSGDPSVSITLRKGGICCLNVEQLSAGKCATLEWLLTPAHLAGLG